MEPRGAPVGQAYRNARFTKDSGDSRGGAGLAPDFHSCCGVFPPAAVTLIPEGGDIIRFMLLGDCGGNAVAEDSETSFLTLVQSSCDLRRSQAVLLTLRSHTQQWRRRPAWGRAGGGNPDMRAPPVYRLVQPCQPRGDEAVSSPPLL